MSIIVRLFRSDRRWIVAARAAVSTSFALRACSLSFILLYLFSKTYRRRGTTTAPSPMEVQLMTLVRLILPEPREASSSRAVQVAGFAPPSRQRHRAGLGFEDRRPFSRTRSLALLPQRRVPLEILSVYHLLGLAATRLHSRCVHPSGVGLTR